MDSLFDPEEDAATRSYDTAAWVAAYVEELRANPPVQSAAGDSCIAKSARVRYAKRDIQRSIRAAARLGCTVRLIPLPAISVALNVAKIDDETDDGENGELGGG